jgi:endonuclease/exonuclease/phosphatase family metal-dependent hydrolase
MARFARTITKRFLIFINLVIANLFLIACANAWLHPDRWWFFSLLGLAFPILLIFSFAFLVFWAVLRSKWFVISAIALILGLPNIRAFWGLHYFSSFQPEKKENSIRILHWNVEWFNESTKLEKGKENYREKMLEFIKEQNADIMCFQEFFEPGKGTWPYSNVKDVIRLNYPYLYRAVDYGVRGGRFEAGPAIFSRYPIVDTMRIRYPGPEDLRAAESLIAADVQVGDRRIRVYTTHLQSVLFRGPDYRHLEIIKSADDSIMSASKSIVKKLRRGYSLRAGQVDIVRAQLDSCPYPELITGDFNDVPNSYTYFHIKGNRQDVFIREGSGIGRSFSRISPTLRIDYILADKRFDVLQYKRFLIPFSDHYPIVADLKLPEER